MKVYVLVLTIAYEGCTIEAIYKDQDKAEKECAKLNKLHGYCDINTSACYDIEAWEVKDE